MPAHPSFLRCDRGNHPAGWSGCPGDYAEIVAPECGGGAAGCIPVDRSKKDNNAKILAIDVLKNNGAIGIFPEGTINRTNDIIMPFKYGAIKMAKETNSYIVPFAITNKYKFFKKFVIISFGKPYKVTGDIKKENIILEEKVMKLIRRNYERRT